MIALRHMRLPEVESTGPDSVIVHPITSRAPVPLAIRHSAYAFVFGLYAVSDGDVEGGGAGAGKGLKRTVAILDPAGLETRLTEGSMVVAVNAQKELCVVHKGICLFRVFSSFSLMSGFVFSAGGVPLSPAEVMGLVNVAVREAIAMEEHVNSKLKEDWEGRKAEVEVR
jgi:exosome complex component RRP45